MMTLDHLTCNVQTLDTVGIDGALRQPAGIGNLAGLGIEHLDKVATDNLALLLRVAHTCQIRKELLAGIDTNHVQTQHLVIVHHLLKLVLTEHAVVDEDTSEVLTNGTVEQDCCHRTVDTATQTQDDTILPQLSLQLSHSRIDERCGAPFLTRTADINHEILQQLLALKRMVHLGVELYGPDGLLRRSKSGIDDIGRRTDDLKVAGDGGNRVTMTHPHLRLLLELLKERIRGIYRLKVGTSILARIGLLDLSTKCVRDKLGAVADAQYRDAPNKLRQVDLKGLGIVNREGRTAQDHTNHRRIVLRELVVRQNLAEGIQFTHTTANQLCRL